VAKNAGGQGHHSENLHGSNCSALRDNHRNSIHFAGKLANGTGIHLLQVDLNHHRPRIFCVGKAGATRYHSINLHPLAAVFLYQALRPLGELGRGWLFHRCSRKKARLLGTGGLVKESYGVPFRRPRFDPPLPLPRENRRSVEEARPVPPE